MEDSKNKYNLAFCSLLLQLNIFKEVYLSMLPPGHTHEFQDAEFSVIKRAYRAKRTSTLNDFPVLANKAFVKTNKHRASLEVLLFDWKGWLKPFILSITGHSRPHVFYFKWNEDESKVLMTFKNWSTDPTPFHGSEEHPEGFEVYQFYILNITCILY